MLNQALRYEEAGFSVIPVHFIGADGRCSCGSARCRSPGKHPKVTWRANQTTRLTADELRKLLADPKTTNVGIVTGPISGIMVLDIDGEEGLKSLKDAGFPLESFPDTPTVRTGGGGLHLYFRYPKEDQIKTQAGVLHKVDIRAQGGFVVAPPSLHKSGKRYAWLKGKSLDDVEIAEIDLSGLLGTRQVVPKKIRATTCWHEELMEGAPEGERNSSATRLTGRYLSRGMSVTETLFTLSAWNQKNRPPLAERELAQIVQSVAKAEGQQGHGLEWISGILGVNVVAIRRITGDEPKIIMEFDEGACTMTMVQMLSAGTFQAAIADATKVIVMKRSSKTNPTHEKLVQAILRESVDEDAGAEATWVGEMKALLKDYVVNQRSIIEVEDKADVPMSGPFRAHGKVWVSILDVIQRSSTRWGVKPQNTTQMAQRMRSLGIEPRAFRAIDGTTRSAWGIPEREVA
jgi:hypothetical protein